MIGNKKKKKLRGIPILSILKSIYQPVKDSMDNRLKQAACSIKPRLRLWHVISY